MISAAEWDKVGEAARTTYDPAQIVLFLGLIMEVMPDDERAEFEAELPGPVRIVWALVGRHAYRRMMDRLQPVR